MIKHRGIHQPVTNGSILLKHNLMPLLYDHNLKFASDGVVVAYLKGDILRSKSLE